MAIANAVILDNMVSSQFFLLQDGNDGAYNTLNKINTDKYEY